MIGLSIIGQRPRHSVNATRLAIHSGIVFYSIYNIPFKLRIPADPKISKKIKPTTHDRKSEATVFMLFVACFNIFCILFLSVNFSLVPLMPLVNAFQLSAITAVLTVWLAWILIDFCYKYTRKQYGRTPCYGRIEYHLFFRVLSYLFTFISIFYGVGSMYFNFVVGSDGWCDIFCIIEFFCCGIAFTCGIISISNVINQTENNSNYSNNYRPMVFPRPYSLN